MVNYELLFLLILVALSLLTIAVLGVIFVLITEDREKKSKAIERSIVAAAQKCPHFFGYLVQQPRNQPIPHECLGCGIVLECKQARVMEVTISRKKK